jgi:transketolase
MRPADANETAAAWKVAVEWELGPVALVLSRQALPILPKREGFERGAYNVNDVESPAVVLVASGSEVSLALGAAKVLAERNVAARVVSMPSWELFRAQSSRYRASVLPKSARKVAIEAGATMGWREWVGDRGAVIGLDRFGASAPGAVLMNRLGFNVENVVETARAVAGKKAVAPAE